MSSGLLQLDGHLVKEIIDSVVRITQADRACILQYDPAAQRLRCRYGTECSCYHEGFYPLCESPLTDSSCNQPENSSANGTATALHDSSATANTGGDRVSSQMLIPLKRSPGSPLGMLILALRPATPLPQWGLEVVSAVAEELCTLVLRESQKHADSARMIRKLGLLSEAHNVLLAEFENKSLEQKLDHVVAKAAEILEAELCSLWLVRDGQICLETSYSQEGRAFIKRKLAYPIVDGPQIGMTSHIAFHKKVFNAYGEAIDHHPARNPEKPVDFLASQKMYSELAYPILDGEKLLGFLFAYNKLDAAHQPSANGGFSEEFDEPIMKILTTKLRISIKNALLMKKLRDYESIVESTPDPVVMCARNGDISYMNPGAKNLFGDLVGTNVVERYPASELQTGEDKAKEIRMLARRSKDHRLKNFETEFLSKSGERIPLSLSASILPDGGTVGIAKDLREIKAVLAMGQALLSTHNVEEILRQITAVCLRLPKCKRAYFKHYDEKTDRLVFHALSSKDPHEQFPQNSTPKHQGLSGYVFETQEPVNSADVTALPADRYHALFGDVKSEVVVPITYFDKELNGSHTLGVLCVDSSELDAFSSNDFDFVKTLANQAAVALENANLIVSKNKIIAKLRAFDRVQQAATGKDPDFMQICASVLDAVVYELGFDYATMSKVDHAQHRIGTVDGRNAPEEFLKLAWHSLDSKDIQSWVVRHRSTAELSGWDERLDREIYEKFDHQRFVRVIIPIVARGEVLGTLETGYEKSRKSEIAPDEKETLERLVNLARIGIEQATLLKKMKEDLALRTELEMQLDALNQASLEILNATTEKEAMEDIFASLKSIGYAQGMLSLVNEATGMLEGKYAAGENWKALVGPTHYDLKSRNVLAQAIRTKSPISIQDCASDPNCDPAFRELMKKSGITAQYIIPLIVKGKAIGTLQIGLSDKPELVREEEAIFRKRMKVVETFACQVAVAIRNIRDIITIDRLESNIAETAHEFRSPLHNIMAQVGGLKDFLEQSRSDKLIDQYVGVIEEEILRAKRQMDNTLLLSERTREKLEYVLKPGALQEVIEFCTSAYNMRALERGLRFVIKDNVKRLPRIAFDRDRMEQAFTNLIDNAVKYSHFNQLIVINGFDDGANLNVEITNRGLGIPVSDYEVIFKSFSRSKVRDKRRYISGTGLGLKICREIIQRHGGEVHVKSEPCSKNPVKVKEFQDFLTTFRITLPKTRREH
ncbi:GAF domain-containing protein [candidate division KSB1 bacterium]|nr:GAF domain-containing protein [candidate division KSB1 bacterium]